MYNINLEYLFCNGFEESKKHVLVYQDFNIIEEDYIIVAQYMMWKY